jgi:hypothetical protein
MTATGQPAETAAAPHEPDAEPRPQLLFFYRANSGPSRRVEGFLAQVLQRRRNHDTFRVRRIDYGARPDLAERCGVEDAPAIVVVHQRRVQARIGQPRGCAEIREGLAPWLR